MLSVLRGPARFALHAESSAAASPEEHPISAGLLCRATAATRRDELPSAFQLAVHWNVAETDPDSAPVRATARRHTGPLRLIARKLFSYLFLRIIQSVTKIEPERLRNFNLRPVGKQARP